MKKILSFPLVSALFGGIIVAGALFATGVVKNTHTTTTVVEQTPLSAGTPARDTTDGGALTPREIYERDAQSVGYITSEIVQKQQSPFDVLPQEQRGVGIGSGFVVDKKGLLVTNAHVVQGAVKVSVRFGDKKTVPAKVVGSDVSTDIAVLKIDPAGLNLKPLQLGASSAVRVGDPVVAIGNPFGLDRTLTTGVVSALQRRIEAQNGFAISNVIQTDAAINHGNSGGPLLNAQGEVIGINSQIQSSGESGGSVGVGFAVPSDTVKQIVPQLENKGRVDRAYLGVESVTIDSSLQQLNLPATSGALVQAVQQGSAAEKAGLKAGDVDVKLAGRAAKIGGDIIQSIDDKPVRTADDLVRIISEHKPNDTVEIGILRGKSERKKIKVKLGSRPNRIVSE